MMRSRASRASNFRITIAGRADGSLVELHRVESPLDPIRVEITEPRLLRLDGEGGLHVNVSVSGDLGAGAADPRDPHANPKWMIEYLELEVSGRALEGAGNKD